MFDNIHFFNYIGVPLTNENIARKVHPHSERVAVIHPQIYSEKDIISENSFVIDGQMKLLFPFPINDFERTHYFYPQIFCICHSSASYFTKRSNHDSYMVLFTYEGMGILEYDGYTYHLKAGDGFIIDCRKPHYYQTDGDYWLHCDLHFNGSISCELYAEYEKKGAPVFHEPIDGQYHLLLEKIAAVWDSGITYKALQISNCISEIITHLLLLKSLEFNNSKAPLAISFVPKLQEIYWLFTNTVCNPYPS